MKQTNDLFVGRRRGLKTLVVAPLAAPLAALLGGCEQLVPGQGPPPVLYRLTPKSTFREDLPVVRWQLILELPLANAGLNTTRIALWPNPTQIDYYARASWTDRAPAMIQTLMIESFENAKRIVSVGRESIGLRADFVLKTEIREFQSDYLEPGKPLAHVGINAKLVAMPERAIVGSESFDSLVAAKADRMPDIIDAFDEALGKCLRRLVEWTLVTGEAVHQRRRAGS
ncbi:MAG: ABC-type transport auxiliary lipoprotein family protein [Rhodospirillales bacterium]|nr:ABC-type transport auxiliary lipoprotein family protein [Rhodospirillales bacterium]